MLNVLVTASLVGVGAFFGGCLRGILAEIFNHPQAKYPYGTLFANVLGCFLIGIIAAKVSDQTLTSLGSALLATGFCGGLTTFSTFTLEVYQLFSKEKALRASTYWLGTTLLCLLCVLFGIAVYHLF